MSAIAPKYPSQTVQAWEQMEENLTHQKTNPRIQSFPEDVTDLAERGFYSKELKKDIGKNSVSKTYKTIKDILHLKFKKHSNGCGSLNDLNNVAHIQQIENQSTYLPETVRN